MTSFSLGPLSTEAEPPQTTKRTDMGNEDEVDRGWEMKPDAYNSKALDTPPTEPKNTDKSKEDR